MASQPSRRTLIIAVQWILTVTVAGAMAFILASNWSELASRLPSVSAGTVAAIAAAGLVLFAFNALVLRALARPFGVHLGLAEAFTIASVDFMLNYLPLKGGTVATGTILWHRYKLAPTRFAAMITGTSIMSLWVDTTLGSGLLLARGVTAAWVWALLLVPTAAVGLLVAWSVRFDGHMPDTEHAHWLVRTVNRVLDGLRAIFSDVKLVALMAFYCSMRVTIVGVQLMAAFAALSAPIDLGAGIVMSSLAVLLSTVAIIPGALGFREGGVAGVAALLGFSATVGLAASLIERMVTVALTAAIGIPSAIRISRSISWAKMRSGSEQEQA